MIKICVDSSADYYVADLNEKGIDIVHLGLMIGEQEYTDGVNLNRDQFYELVNESGQFPKTSQPSPQIFVDLFEQAKTNQDELICILLSSALSGTVQAARLAASMVEYDGIYIIDSKTATFTIKIMADYALSLRDKGYDAKSIVEEIEKIKSKVKVVAALDTLEFLGKGGRISHAAATIGNMAGIKPVITVNEAGEVAILGKNMGRNKAMNQVLKYVQECGIDRQYPVYLIYSYGTENAEKFRTKFEPLLGQVDDLLQIGPVIGSHIGPGAFGMIYVSMK